MKRRTFIYVLAALTASAALPANAAAENVLLPFWERGWDFAIAKDFETMWWDMTAVFKPNGVRYGWRVSTTFLVDRGISAEAFLAQQLGRVNPLYAEEALSRRSVIDV